MIIFTGRPWQRPTTCSLQELRQDLDEMTIEQMCEQGCSEEEIVALIEPEKEKRIKMSDELTALRTHVAELEDAAKYLLDVIEYPPGQHCNCHINPPCHDCVEFSALREAIAEMEQALKKK